MSLLDVPKSGEGRGEERCRVVVCSFCGYVTDRKNNLKRHIQTMHEESSVELECCGQRFFNKADMRAHTRALHRDGYMCPVCRHVFCRKALLKRHLSVHTGIKEYICCLCGYDTSHKSNLERHMRTHAKDKEENKSKKDATLLQAPTTLPAQQAIPRAPPPAMAAPKALHEQLLPSKAVNMCDSQWASVWALQHGYQLSPPSLSPPPPPLLRYPAEACLQPARHPYVPSRSNTIEEVLRNSALQQPQPPQPRQLPQPAGPSQGTQNAPRPERSQPTAFTPHICASSAKILRPTPIRPHAKDFPRRLPQSSIAYQGRLLAVVDVTPPIPNAFVPPPPPPLPPPRLNITPSFAFMPYHPQPHHRAHAHLPPLQCIANPLPPPGDPLGVPTLKETPPPESTERVSSPERGSSPEEHHHAAGEEYVHKKLRFSRKLRQVEVEQLCSDSQEMPRN